MKKIFLQMLLVFVTKNDKTKWIFMILLIALITKGFGQTYTMQLHVYVTKGTASVSSNIDGNIYTFTNPNNYGSQGYPSPFTVKGNTFTFNLSTNSGSCSQNLSVTKSLLELLRDDVKVQSCPAGGGGGYDGNFYPITFKPDNIGIARISNADVCAGEQLELYASSPNIFPKEVYHWQYSLDNQITWFDLPYPFNGKQINLFTIQEILGNLHEQYYNKQIHFRLGYGQKRAITSPLAITYSACAPEVKSISYTAPKCNGDAVQDITLTFNRDLKAGEYLYPFSIVEESDHSKFVYQSPDKITLFEGSDPLNKTFSIKNVTGLKNGVYYIISYQAYDGSINRGILWSPAFIHVEPAPLKYAVSNLTQPTCFGGSDGSIEIQLLSGTAPYHFYQDGTEVTPTLENGKYYLRGLSVKSGGYTIKVTDTNGCIEK